MDSFILALLNTTYMNKMFYSLAVFALVACGGGSGSDDPDPTPTPTPTPTVGNVNKNDASENPYLARLEMPKAKSGSTVITHATANFGVTYSIEWDSSIRAQRWTCYDLNKKNVATNGNTRRSLWPERDPWAYDPDVAKSEQQQPTNELSKSYYPGTTDAYYEKGHICPSMDRLNSKDANEQTYYMTNILPMVSKFNGKLWQKMETQVNTWGKALADGDTIFVCKGGTIDKADQILGKTIGNHVVPKYFFMALYAKTSTGQRMLGFWAEHLNEDHSNDALKGYVVSIDELEQKTGIDFFCNLSDTLEEQLESKTAADIISAWGL